MLAIPPKRCDRAIVSFLTAEEIDALLAAPDRATWLGRRDHALLLIAVQTGLRVSELTGLTCSDVHLGPGTHVRCHGKGRKDRATPPTRQTVTVLRAWLAERGGQPAGIQVRKTGHRRQEPVLDIRCDDPVGQGAELGDVLVTGERALPRWMTARHRDVIGQHGAVRQGDLSPAAKRPLPRVRVVIAAGTLRILARPDTVRLWEDHHPVHGERAGRKVTWEAGRGGSSPRGGDDQNGPESSPRVSVSRRFSV